jgi:predicted ATP-dependent endonuclease of OLD family
MKILKIEVENFKSIDKYDFEIADFNIFVGKNNHGKTNLFDALDWFDSGKTDESNFRNHNREVPIKVRVHFTSVQSAIEAMEDGAYKTSIGNALAGSDNLIVEKSSKTDKRVLIVAGAEKKNPTGFDAALNYFLPKIVYVTTKHRLADVSGYKARSPIAEMLGDVLKDMVNNEPKYKAFIEMFDELFNTSDSIFRTSVNELQEKVEGYLEKQFAEDAKVKFIIENPAIEDMLKKFETEVDDGVKTKAEHKGDGMQRALMLAIVQAYADYRKQKGIARNFLFLIDEAELHLHPTAQRSLKNALRDIVDTQGQVLINSHSPIFANEKFANQKIFKVEKNSGCSEIMEVVTEQEQLDSIYQLLGGSPHDILLPNNFIIVEGQSEYVFLETIIKRFYNGNAKCNAIKVIFARGDHEKQKDLYHCIHECYKPLLTNGIYKERVVFLLDKPDPAKLTAFNTFKTGHPWLKDNINLFELPVGSIEMYYPGTYAKTEIEVKAMVAPKEKTRLATEVSGMITENQFQNDMPVIYKMLESAIALAYD